MASGYVTSHNLCLGSGQPEIQQSYLIVSTHSNVTGLYILQYSSVALTVRKCLNVCILLSTNAATLSQIKKNNYLGALYIH